MRRPMRIGSLFAGIGGLELGLERAGVGEVVWQVEINPFCRSVLERHWPGAVRHEDVRVVGRGCLDAVDVVCGGFPCQDVSSAGKRVGLAGERSGLWFEYLRIVRELQPRFVVVENVFSGKGLWLATVKDGLQRAGYRTRAFTLSAASVGAPHLRKRVFVVASHADGQRHQQGLIAVDDAAGHAGADGAGLAREGAQPPSWPAPPALRGVDDGLPGRVDGSGGSARRVDRLRALGNAVVPQCSEAIGRVLLGIAAGDVSPEQPSTTLPHKPGAFAIISEAIDDGDFKRVAAKHGVSVQWVNSQRTKLQRQGYTFKAGTAPGRRR